MKSLPDKVEQLFEKQIVEWPLLARGIEAVRLAQTRKLKIDWYDVYVRHVPHRLTSSTAKIDKASIESRPCFLCDRNRPVEQKGIGLDAEFVLFCNPYPILHRHLTIMHREHRPQLIGNHLGSLLDIAEALPGYFIVYNGPEAGASAPDHLHFQACSREFFPVESDMAGVIGPGVENYGRRVLLFRDDIRSRLLARLAEMLGALTTVTAKSPEPMLNIAAFHTDNGWTVFVFPRGKHRPEVYHSGRLTVSPGTIDLCGLFVLPHEKDFVQIDAADIQSVLAEVTLPEDQFRQVIEIMGSSR